MRKLITKKINQNVLFWGLISVSLLAMMIIIIVCESKEVYKMTCDFGFSIFLCVIAGSSIYSVVIIKYDLYYQVSFGVTRKELYTKYLKTLFMVLGIVGLYIIVAFLSLLLAQCPVKVMTFMIDLHLPFFSTFYLFSNMIFFILGKYKIKNFVMYILVLVVIVLALLTKFIGYFEYSSLAFLMLGLLLLLYNRNLITKKIEIY